MRKRSQATMGVAASDAGASAEHFTTHPGYRRMFAENHLTLGIFLPLRFFSGDMSVLRGQADLVGEIDRLGFAAVWARDVPLFDPKFGDAGQLFDPMAYLSYLAARTERISLATGSTIFSLRHPIDLAKNAATVDQLSGGRLVLGIASGDRPVEFPAYGLDIDTRGERFAETVRVFRQLLTQDSIDISSPIGNIQGVQLLPKPSTGRVPLIVTGSSRQPLEWIAKHADGWLTYPGPTSTKSAVMQLKPKIDEWRAMLPEGEFRPHMTNEWIDLVEEPEYPRTPMRGGFIMRTGRNGLIKLLEEWRSIGVNHVALGIQFSQRPASDVIRELAEEVLPLFPALDGPPPRYRDW